ncbi:phosphoribosyltransferase family protein [Thermogladius sp. 4427co]|uniref:phosphoribosyltransferase family protein n=1 Tax=Thermogladius sp. 4427co TaxID=3450718 RepID=UPI003F794D53
MVRSSLSSFVVRKPLENEISQMMSNINRVYGGTKANRMKIRLLANEMLRLLKRNLSYKDLTALTGIPESVLCRYVRGNIIPSYEQAVGILSKLALSIDINHLLRELVEHEKSTLIDLSRVLKDPYIIRLLSIILLLELVSTNVTKIIVTAESVLPIGTILGIELGAPVLLVKRRSYPGVQYYSSMVIRSPKEAENLYIDRDLLSRKDNVLILADVVYTGKTLHAVIDILEKARVTIAEIIVILGLGNMWRERLRDYPVKVLTTLPPPVSM